MVALVDDGPREWAIDALNRKLGRVFAAVSAVAMLATVRAMEPGAARIILSIGAVVLFVVAAAMPCLRRRLEPEPAISAADVAAELMRFRAYLAERETDVVGQLDTVTDAVLDIRNQLR